MFSVYTTPEEFENATIIGYFGLAFEQEPWAPAFEENSVREIT